MSVASEGLGKAKGGSISRATYNIDEVAGLFNIGRNQAYEGARRGDFPTIRVGRSIRAPKALIDEMLGIKGDAG